MERWEKGLVIEISNALEIAIKKQRQTPVILENVSVNGKESLVHFVA